MNKHVIGSYQTVDEAKQAAKNLIDQGQARDELTLAANQATAQQIDTDIPVKVYGNHHNENHPDEDNDDSVIDKIKDVFTGDSDDHSLSHTSNEENTLLDEYQADISRGSIVLLAEERLDTNVSGMNADRPIIDSGNSADKPVIDTNDSVDKPVVDPINPASDVVVDSKDDPSVDPAIAPTDKPGIDPTEPAHQEASQSTERSSDKGGKVDKPVIDPINPASDVVVDSENDPSVDPAITPADDPDIDPTDPAHRSPKK
ncbi:general stress protein [Marinilactibacillus piezotolerans]|uniref:general stress protein n=1 Tax=Marinilactibacillus piezotolerans TaxID=258723 RepID=UPI0009B057F9|nr:general stress protein [Marinilactibacillus piezotolerans]